MDFREEEEAEKVNITKKNNEIYDRILTKINSEMQPMDFLDEEGIEGIAIAEVPSFDFREEAGTNKTKNFHLSYSVKDPTNLNARPPRPGTGLSIGIFIGKICIFLFILSPIFWKTIKSIIKKF